MNLTPSQQKAIDALIAAGETEAAHEASRAFADGKTYNASKRRLPTRIKKFISDANFWTAQGRK